MSDEEDNANSFIKLLNERDEEKVRKSQDGEPLGNTIRELAAQCCEAMKSAKSLCKARKKLNRKWIEKSVRQCLDLPTNQEVQQLGMPVTQKELSTSPEKASDKPAVLMVPKGLSEDEEMRLRLAEMHIKIPSIPRSPTPNNTLPRRRPPYAWNPAMRYQYQIRNPPVDPSAIPSHSGDEK
ncbi:hypothetical protein M514_01511 [Trichuris suis]|uniref:Uncharacterized protein n=1 Tax=Trichuris suis TaxID=68888 RepID=A0A085NAL7_9BILA|nr:hypothetical protein M513_01511 [Trichuris suis]KFD66513.1 hypothetical protein M514_01511 [Trichuris suis]KHJ49066.1 hypothetical protein D918_00184 [Trichuris suis]